ncbi:MAG TPA: HD domain-containing phosphohydrolase [Rhizomicrobium sp.]
MALVAAAFRLAHNERVFELDRWAIRLHAAGTQRLGMVNEWLSESRAALRSVAVNPTVQIYLSQAAANPAPTPESEAQAAFLQSYVISLGSRGAFASSKPSMPSETGIAVLDSHRHLVAATYGYRPPAQLIAALLAQSRDGTTGPSLSQAKDGSPVAFLAEVRPIQGMMSAPAVGYVIGERVLDRSVWSGSTLAADHGHESLIAAANDKASLIGSSVTGVAAGSGEVLAAQAPLHLQRAPDLNGKDALHLGIPVKGTNWVLVETVRASSALAGVDARIRSLLTILLLSLLAIILGLLLLWRHVTAGQQAAAREAGVRLYRDIAEVLLQAIDLRDPGAAEHSRRVASLSRQVALRIGADADAAELAGALMNVGKLFVPVNVLTKTGGLEESEAAQFAEGSARWLDLLARASLDPPLAPVLRDADHLMRGESTAAAPSRVAHIIAAANKAVALMSPRAYRMAHTPQETLEILAKSRPAVPPAILTAMADLLKQSK